MEQVCAQCGGRSFHYSRSRMRMECDACGAPVYDPQREQRLMEYDRTYSQAMGHLAAGNWDQAIRILWPLLEEYPTEKRLYLALLRSATRDFRDLSMEDPSRRAMASQAWDKLVRLNGVTGEMVRYGRQRYERRREELGGQRGRLLKWIFSAALCALLAGLFFGMEEGALGVLCIGGLALCLRRAASLHPGRVLRRLRAPPPGGQDDPFG